MIRGSQAILTRHAPYPIEPLARAEDPGRRTPVQHRARLGGALPASHVASTIRGTRPSRSYPRDLPMAPTSPSANGLRSRIHGRNRRAGLALSALLVLMAGWGCSGGSTPDTAAGDRATDTGPLVVYLVRHAERDEDGTNDPPISEAGRARAELLATMLADAGIQRIHATAFKRTVQTAAPMAMDLGLDEVEGYDARDLASLNDRLQGAGGRHLVVGHSSTTYIVTVVGGEVSSTLIRFGVPSPS
jgi:hypothetical protein